MTYLIITLAILFGFFAITTNAFQNVLMDTLQFFYDGLSKMTKRN